MNATYAAPSAQPSEAVPSELTALWEQVRGLPPEIGRELTTAVADAIEQARFRGRALGIAKEAIERLRLDLELTRFDLELTRRERDARAAS